MFVRLHAIVRKTETLSGYNVSSLTEVSSVFGKSGEIERIWDFSDNEASNDVKRARREVEICEAVLNEQTSYWIIWIDLWEFLYRNFAKM